MGCIIQHGSNNNISLVKKNSAKREYAALGMWQRTLFFSLEEYVNVQSSFHLNVVFFSLCTHG